MPPEQTGSPTRSDTAASITMKGGLVPMTIIDVQRLDENDFKATLEAKVAQMPAFFDGSPVVIALEKVAEETANLGAFVTTCRTLGLVPVAIRGGNPDDIQNARQLGLAALPAASRKSEPQKIDTIAQTEQAAEVPAPQEKAVSSPETKSEPVHLEPAPTTKIVYHPVRSGQQVYAKDADLIVLAPVSAGAEILADGNIHVYGPLRGRALAGIKGNTQARIFCQSLEAELVSVAGQYKISEDLQSEGWQQPRQIYLDGEKLSITPLTA